MLLPPLARMPAGLAVRLLARKERLKVLLVLAAARRARPVVVQRRQAYYFSL